MYLNSALANVLRLKSTRTSGISVCVEIYVLCESQVVSGARTPRDGTAKWVYCTESNGSPCLHYGSWDDLGAHPLLSAGYVPSFLVDGI